jgi:hypothetical protein
MFTKSCSDANCPTYKKETETVGLTMPPVFKQTKVYQAVVLLGGNQDTQP